MSSFGLPNLISSSVPVELGRLSKLTELVLEQNALYGRSAAALVAPLRCSSHLFPSTVAGGFLHRLVAERVGAADGAPDVRAERAVVAQSLLLPAAAAAGAVPDVHVDRQHERVASVQSARQLLGSGPQGRRHDLWRRLALLRPLDRLAALSRRSASSSFLIIVPHQQQNFYLFYFSFSTTHRFTSVR